MYTNKFVLLRHLLQIVLGNIIPLIKRNQICGSLTST